MQRKKVAAKMQNPNLNRIHFHTLRHWSATMLFHKTKNLPLVKERLGHKRLDSTRIYTHLVSFEADEYHHAASKTVKEACELIDAGFEYVTEQDGIKLWRKRK